MLKSLLVSVLERNLGHFVESDLSSLKVGLWNGKIRLTDVALRPEALYTLGLPLSVRSGKSLGGSGGHGRGRCGGVGGGGDGCCGGGRAAGCRTCK